MGMLCSDFYVFDFSAKCWFKCDVDPKELGCHADIGSLTVLPANRAMYIFGGADENGTSHHPLFGALQRFAHCSLQLCGPGCSSNEHFTFQMIASDEYFTF